MTIAEITTFVTSLITQSSGLITSIVTAIGTEPVLMLTFVVPVLGAVIGGGVALFSALKN